MNLERLQKLLNSSAGDDLKEFLLSEISKMSDIENIKDYSKAQDLAIEVKAQKKAKEKLECIYNYIIDFSAQETENNEDYSIDVK
ncbi:MAG: hypothetical protein PHS54_01525 [Clostridia bacterium]|nr:hypothetical protein [Clostridia bacterium]